MLDKLVKPYWKMWAAITGAFVSAFIVQGIAVYLKRYDVDVPEEAQAKIQAHLEQIIVSAIAAVGAGLLTYGSPANEAK